MTVGANFVEVAALVGDTARATMLSALMSGQALTGSELSFLAQISRSTASEHLSKLTESHLVSFTKIGRFSYYRISSPLVALMMESITAVAAIELPSRYQPRSAHADALRFARTCYDHLAGQLGVAITDFLVREGHLLLSDEGGELTLSGRDFLEDFGTDVTSKPRTARCFCRPCLDWSERRYHVAGRVGNEIWKRCLGLGWVSKARDSRALHVTPVGRIEMARLFRCDFLGEKLDSPPPSSWCRTVRHQTFHSKII